MRAATPPLHFGLSSSRSMRVTCVYVCVNECWITGCQPLHPPFFPQTRHELFLITIAVLFLLLLVFLVLLLGLLLLLVALLLFSLLVFLLQITNTPNASPTSQFTQGVFAPTPTPTCTRSHAHDRTCTHTHADTPFQHLHEPLTIFLVKYIIRCM